MLPTSLYVLALRAPRRPSLRRLHVRSFCPAICGPGPRWNEPAISLYRSISVPPFSTSRPAVTAFTSKRERGYIFVSTSTFACERLSVVLQLRSHRPPPRSQTSDLTFKSTRSDRPPCLCMRMPRRMLSALNLLNHAFVPRRCRPALALIGRPSHRRRSKTQSPQSYPNSDTPTHTPILIVLALIQSLPSPTPSRPHVDPILRHSKLG
jgi:hypothetical protein